jgi:glutamate-1-semialdehyde 2,1-aminomutase
MSRMSLRRNLTVEDAVAEVSARLRQENPASARRQAAAEAHMPGGNTRTLLYYPPFPIAFAGGKGARLTDLDGHEYLDLVSEQSAAVYGHSEPRLIECIARVARDGINLGGPNRYEAELAAVVTRRFPMIEQVRFCNSGTEANMFALSTARAVTGRDKVMVFAGAYHGGLLWFPNGPGALNAPVPVVIAPFNDGERTLRLIEENADSLAAVLIEPMMGGGGCLPASRAFLTALRRGCDQHGIVLIFDEVMTSRLGPHGLQETLGVRSDLTTLGKYVGGGMPIGAFGGRAALMARFDPRRPDHWNHAGTFNNNVLTMAAGVVGLTQVFTPEAAVELNDKGERLRARLDDAARRRALPVTVTGVGSLMTIHFSAGPVDTPADVARANQALKPLLHLDLLLDHVYIAKRGYIALSMPVSEADLDMTVASFEGFLDRWGALIEESQGNRR